MGSNASLQYRPDIDGLRAIAVLAVVFFHAELGFAGGFVGVDVFFVISGFLITSLIMRDLREGSFTLAQFWERRARRILPVAVVVALSTLVAGWFLLLPSDYILLGRSAFWQSLFASNFHFWRETNYFASAAEEQPLLHTWSLAVEEQFYFLYPLLLLLLHRVSRGRRHAGPLGLLICGTIISLAASVVLVTSHRVAAFYLLPTRAWELLLGGILALAPDGLRMRARLWRELVAYLGLIGVLYPCLVYTNATPFPGSAALLPCLGTMLIMMANRPDGAEGASTSLSWFLSTGPVVFIGLISYSLYLWHWPLFAFSRYWALEPLGLGWRLGVIVAALALATLSWQFLELPFRRKRLAKTRANMFAYAVGGIAATACLATVIAMDAGIPRRLSEQALLYDDERSEMTFTTQMGPRDAAAERFVRIGDTAPNAPVRILVWGDSHAMAVMPAIESLCKELRAGGEAATHSSTAPVLDYYQREKFGLFGDEAIAFNRSVLQHVERRRIPNVLLVARWSGYDDSDPPSPDQGSSQPFAEALLNTVRHLREVGATVWVLEQWPSHPVSVRKDLAIHAVFGLQGDLPAGTPESNDRETSTMRRLRPALERAGARILDARPFLLDRNTGRFMMSNGGPAFYTDKHHLSSAGALFIRELFRPILSR